MHKTLSRSEQLSLTITVLTMADAALRWNKTLAICFAIVAHLAITKGSDFEDLFPLLMPKVHPTLVETYLCTSIRLNDAETHYVIGFKPNATMHTAHHMLIYGCEEPGSDADVFNCGEMATQEPGEKFKNFVSKEI